MPPRLWLPNQSITITIREDFDTLGRADPAAGLRGWSHDPVRQSATASRRRPRLGADGETPAPVHPPGDRLVMPRDEVVLNPQQFAECDEQP